MTMSIVAGVIGLVWLFSGFLFAPAPRNPHPLAILVWLAFGGGVALVSRWAARPAVLGAAALLSVVAVVDLFVPLLHAGGGPVGLISSSEYTWIAIAILAANGALPERSSSRSSRGDANTPAPR